MTVAIRQKDRDALLTSLRAGVVPKFGQHLIQVGRASEIDALIADLKRVADGGSFVRFIIGEYGAGKTFFLNLIRTIALEKKFVTVNADLSPDRRLQASRGQARSLYSELMRNMSTRSKPGGGAMPNVIERFVSEALGEAQTRQKAPENVIREKLSILSEMVGGYDFAHVVHCYWKGHDTGDEQLKIDAVRWMRAEFSTKTEAREALGVRTIIDDSSFYDSLKLMARFVKLAGFSGLLVCLDEMVNLFKLAHTQSRNANYEQILRILNDCMQGAAAGIGFLKGGTPDFLLDPRRGLYSYEALRSRLAENTFARHGLVDYTGPVLRLDSLKREDFFILLQKLRHVFASGNASNYLVNDQGIEAFMKHCFDRVGDACFRTPRNTIKSFIDLLSILDQNKETSLEQLFSIVEIEGDSGEDLEDIDDDEDATPANTPVNGAAEGLVEFKL